MKNTIIAMLLGAASLSVVSCSNLGAYLSCISADNPEECVIGKGIETAVTYLADANTIDSQEKADAFASKWSTVQTSIETAQNFGMDVPEAAKKAYNKTLTRMQKHSYFNSPTLEAAMKNARTIN